MTNICQLDYNKFLCLTLTKINDNLVIMTHLLLVQEYLKSHSLAELKLEHGVNHRVHNHKMSLNYDMIEAVDSNPLAKQCRGLILGFSNSYVDPNKSPFGETVILARPFDRFFNYGQDAAASIDFEAVNTRFYEKLDGTCIIYYYDGFIDQWCIATRGMPEANLGVDGFAEYTFTTLFQKAILETTGLDYKSWLESLALVLNRNITYVFELTTPLNQIVVRYMNFGVHLIGMRDRVAGTELEIEKWGTELKVPLCPSYQLSNLTDMMKFVAERNALKHEGIVVCDSSFKRVKIKNADYVAYGRIRDQIASTPRALIQVILDEKLELGLHIMKAISTCDAFVLEDLCSHFNSQSVRWATCI